MDPLGSTNAIARSPVASSGTSTTATSRIPGQVSSAFSTSAGETLMPLRMMRRRDDHSQGEAMHPILGAANVDPNAFDDPMTVEFGRRANHIVFASGLHRWIASRQTRNAFAVEELLARTPECTVAPGEELVYDNISVSEFAHRTLQSRDLFGANRGSSKRRHFLCSLPCRRPALLGPRQRSAADLGRPRSGRR
jgi:hypothetical protein